MGVLGSSCLHTHDKDAKVITLFACNLKQIFFIVFYDFWRLLHFANM